MSLKIYFWLFVIATIAFAILLQPRAEAYDLIQLHTVDVTYRSFFNGGVDPLITQNPSLPDRALGKELNLEVDSDILDWFYWNSTVHSMTDHEVGTNSGQFRMVGLEMGLGIDLRNVDLPVSIGYYHYSRHVLDAQDGLGHYPVEDSIELRIHIYESRHR